MIEEKDLDPIVRSKEGRFLIDRLQRRIELPAAHAQRTIDHEDESRRTAIRSEITNGLLDAVFPDSQIVDPQRPRCPHAQRHLDQIDVQNLSRSERGGRDTGAVGGAISIGVNPGLDLVTGQRCAEVVQDSKGLFARHSGQRAVDVELHTIDVCRAGGDFDRQDARRLPARLRRDKGDGGEQQYDGHEMIQRQPVLECAHADA